MAGAIRLSSARRVAAMINARREVPTVVDVGAGPGAGGSRLRSLYVCAVVIGPIAWFSLWIMAFGFRGVVLDDPAAIPGWAALAIPPAIGMILGWRLALVRGSRNRIGVAALVPIVVIAFPLLIIAAGNYLALFALAVLYVVGPVVLGRFLRLVGALLRHRSA